MTNVVLPTWLQNKTCESLPASQLPYRQKHLDAFCQRGLPTNKDERYKYADLSHLMHATFADAKKMHDDELEDIAHHYRLQRGESIMMVFVNGYYMPQLSDLAKLPSGTIACSINEAYEKYSEHIKLDAINTQQYPFASLNAALSQDGLFFYLPAQAELSAPLHIISIIADQEAIAMHPKHYIVLGNESKLMMIEEYASQATKAYMTNAVTNIHVGKDATLHHYKLQQEGMNATHMGMIVVSQQAGSNTYFSNIASGSHFSRDDLVILLNESGADCHTAGFYYLLHDHQYIDHHVDIQHGAPNSQSEMLYKGILENKSKAVFNGRLLVRPHAQKISAYQANHHLLMSKDAEANSKPELEIYADDVKCKHGATTGQIDEEALFYMQSRGIAREEALTILLQGFADEILQRITHVGVKMRVMQMLSHLTMAA